MNTKQFLYDTLKSQLDIKKSECDKYDNEIYQPALNELTTKVNRWFVDNIKGTYVSFDFKGSDIEIRTSDIDRYDYTITLQYQSNFRRSNNTPELAVIYRSNNMYGSNSNEVLNHLNVLNGIANKYSIIGDLIANDWSKNYNELQTNRIKSQEDYNTLDKALNTLKYEIQGDKIASMLEIGFGITSLKKSLHCNYENELVERNKSIELQYGRSKYDTTYAHGFKVLSKKGNKYKIVVYFEDGRQREYDVLEKKFKDFVDKVYSWEYEQADRHNENETKRYKSRLKTA